MKISCKIASQVVAILDKWSNQIFPWFPIFKCLCWFQRTKVKTLFAKSVLNQKSTWCQKSWKNRTLFKNSKYVIVWVWFLLLEHVQLDSGLKQFIVPPTTLKRLRMRKLKISPIQRFSFLGRSKGRRWWRDWFFTRSSLYWKLWFYLDYPLCRDFENFQSSPVCGLCDVVWRVWFFSKCSSVWALWCGAESLIFFSKFPCVWAPYCVVGRLWSFNFSDFPVCGYTDSLQITVPLFVCKCKDFWPQT